MKRTKSAYLLVLIAVLIIGLVFPSMAYGKNVPGVQKNEPQNAKNETKDVNKLLGAIWATDEDGKVINNFDEANDVYIKIGKQKKDGELTGVYYIKVTDPSGKTPLGSGTVNVNINTSGDFYGHAVKSNGLIKLSEVTDFSTTPNHGGVYKVWVSTSDSFTPKYSKTDNFRIGKGNSGTTPGTPTEDFTGVSVVKFYDANVNGRQDEGEDELNWIYNITPSDKNRYETMDGDVELEPGSYDISEYTLEDWNWKATTDTVQEVDIIKNEIETVSFGNVYLCNVDIGEREDLSIGFWRNNNGEEEFEQINEQMGNDHPLYDLRTLHLVSASGGDFNPYSYENLASWLKDANSENMAYMLSAQLSAMKLNTLAGFVDDQAYIYIDDDPDFHVDGLNGLGFITIADLMEAANTSLGGTLGGEGNHTRAYQEFLKDALESANNNECIYVQSEPPMEPYFPVLTEVDNPLAETFGAVRFRNFDNSGGGEVYLSDRQGNLGTVERVEIDFYPGGDWKGSNHLHFEYDAINGDVKVKLNAAKSYETEYYVGNDADFDAIQFMVLDRDENSTVKLENIVVNGLPVQDSITGDSYWTQWNVEEFIKNPDGGFVVEADIVLTGTQPNGEHNKVEIVFGNQ